VTIPGVPFIVIGRNDHRTDGAGVAGAAIHVLDHRPAGNQRERFAREAGRFVAGGNDNNGRRTNRMLGGRNREHDES